MLASKVKKNKTREFRQYRDIVIHIDSNDVRMKESDVTKSNFATACDLAKKMSQH